MRQHKDQLKDRIRELEAQVTRLQDAFTLYVANYDSEIVYQNRVKDSWVPERYGLQPGDLDPIDGGDA